MYTKLFRVQLTEFPHTLLYILTLRHKEWQHCITEKKLKLLYKTKVEH